MTVGAAPGTDAPAVHHDLQIAGLTRLSTCDWPGRIVATVFLQGCPWRCRYCHNPELLDPLSPGVVPWTEVTDLLVRRRGLLDGLVFSGGEPTRQSGVLAAAEQARDLGFAVGLHTSGAYPLRLAAVLPFVDWVGLDVKAQWGEYPSLTGVRASGRAAAQSLDLLIASQVDFEVRITIDPDFHTVPGVLELIDDLRSTTGVPRIVLQQVTGGVGGPLELLDHPPDGVVVRRW